MDHSLEVLKGRSKLEGGFSFHSVKGEYQTLPKMLSFPLVNYISA